MFGEQCCRNEGVPEKCMGLCEHPDSISSRFAGNHFLTNSLPNACSKYEKVITDCGLGDKSG